MFELLLVDDVELFEEAADVDGDSCLFDFVLGNSIKFVSGACFCWFCCFFC